MRQSISKKEYLILGLIFLPIICGLIIQAIAWYSREEIGQWIYYAVYIKTILVNISFSVAGLILCFQPEFFMKFLRKRFGVKNNKNDSSALNFLLRFIGFGVLIIIAMSSCETIQEFGSVAGLF